MSALAEVEYHWHEDIRVAVDESQKEILLAIYKATGATTPLHPQVIQFSDILIPKLLTRVLKDDQKEVSYLWPIVV